MLCDCLVWDDAREWFPIKKYDIFGSHYIEGKQRHTWEGNVHKKYGWSLSYCHATFSHITITMLISRKLNDLLFGKQFATKCVTLILFIQKQEAIHELQTCVHTNDKVRDWSCRISRTR